MIFILMRVITNYLMKVESELIDSLENRNFIFPMKVRSCRVNG